MTEIVKIIQSVGFPVAVAIYLLWKYEKRLKELSDIMQEMSKILAIIKEYVKKANGD